MNLQTVLDRLGALGVVAVVRADDPEDAIAAVDDLVSGGLTVIEVTFSVPDAASVISELTRRGDVIVGAGTVMQEHQAVAALEAGARFLVSPVCPVFLIPAAREADAVAVPGTATPTELRKAVSAGAHVVKVFPAATLGGPAYLKQVLAPLPDIRLMPSGGIGVGDVSDYRRAGAWCVGLGGQLVGAEPGGPRRELAARARGRGGTPGKPGVTDGPIVPCHGPRRRPTIDLQRSWGHGPGRPRKDTRWARRSSACGGT
jgi:2-dehydro-3-deoxyphosphogluconate aldolase / (4S)-4-hydroxy-2-oxoglutarate aldolase